MKINLYFDENNIYTHFFFSELLILWEKNLRIFFWAIGVPKKIPKNIEKIPYRRVAQKIYNFATDAANHTFFDSPCI